MRIADVEHALLAQPEVSVGRARKLEGLARWMLLSTAHRYRVMTAYGRGPAYGNEQPLRYFGFGDDMVMADYQMDIVDPRKPSTLVASHALRLSLGDSLVTIGLEDVIDGVTIGTYARLAPEGEATIVSYFGSLEVESVDLEARSQDEFTRALLDRAEDIFEIGLLPYRPELRGSLNPQE